MELKEEYKKLIGTIQSLYQAKTGEKLKIEDVAKAVGLTRVTVQNLLGEKGKVLPKHISTAKEAYKDLLQNVNSESPLNDKERLISILERENKLLQELLSDLKERVIQRMDSIEVNLNELKEGQKVVAGVAHAALFHAENISAFQQKKQLKDLQKVSDRLIVERSR